MKFKSLKYFAALSLSAMLFLTSCEEDNSYKSSLSGYVGIENSAVLELQEGESGTGVGKVVATEASSVDRTFALTVVPLDPDNRQYTTTMDAASYTVPTTVTIPAGSVEGVFEIQVVANSLPNDAKVVLRLSQLSGTHTAINVDPVTGEGAPVISGGQRVDEIINPIFSLVVYQPCLANPFLVEIVTDSYGSETTWEIYTAAGDLVTGGGAYPDNTPLASYVSNECLEDGSYIFVAYDAYGDGMFDGNNQGYYKLTKYDADGNPVVIAQNGTFGASETVEFSIP